MLIMNPANQKSDTTHAFLAAIGDSSDDAIVGKTLEGIITSWNPGAERMFGYSAQEAVGQHITLIIPRERHGEEDDILAHIRRGEKVDHYETVRQTKDGRRLTISLTVTPIRDPEGRIVGASKVARDITARKQAEQDRALLAAIVDSSDDAIVSKSLDGIIMSWNRGAEKMFGYSAREAIGEHITLIIPSDRHPEEDDVLRHIRRGEKVDHYETVRRAKDGRRVDIALTVSPVVDANGQIIGASKIARDITERKRAEEEREQLLARLEAALQTAEEASRLRDDFLATVSHELRNPLNSIVGWAGLLRSGSLDAEKSVQAVDAIMRNARAQDRIIKDLLDISRMVTGRLRLDIQPLRLKEVVESAIETIRPAMEAKQIRLEASFDPTASLLTGDSVRLRQVFWNLLSNAVKFTSKNGRIQIFSRRIDSHVEIVVSDTGIGIEPSFLPYVFDRFRQAESGSNRQSAGLGLGLAIVRSLVELHGGSVSAASDGRGRGASFTVKLPTLLAFSTTDPAELVHPAVEETPQTRDGPPLKNLRILVVDDEAGAREVIAAILAPTAAEVKEAQSASDALELMDHWLPDVLLADIGMPEVDGYEFIRRVRSRSLESGGAVPAAALTAYARSEDRVRVLAAGYQIHLSKPIQPVELVTEIASLVKRRRLENGVATDYPEDGVSRYHSA